MALHGVRQLLTSNPPTPEHGRLMVFPQKQTKLSNSPTDKWWRPTYETLGNLHHSLKTHFFVGKMKSLNELTAWASFQHKKSYDPKKDRDDKCCQEREEKGAPYTVDGNVNWYSHCGEQYGGSLKTKNRTTI